MTFTRSSGMLLHPTSFPGPYGIGDLGPFAYRFIDYLAETGSKLWQVLPLGPTSYGDSPYQCFSAFAGNPYMVSPDFLMQEGLLTSEDLSDMPYWEPNRVGFWPDLPVEAEAARQGLCALRAIRVGSASQRVGRIPSK